jgi:endonuclease YncB( thermonuclease family)
MTANNPRDLIRVCIRMTYILLAAAAASPSAAKDEPELADLKLLTATVLYCHDGDTCRLKIENGLWLNVRLAGIDAPEVAGGRKKPGQPFGNESRDFLNQQIKAKTVTVRQTDLDPFNRPVVELLTADGTNINRQMIRTGYAEAYRGKTRRLDISPYLADEAVAKSSKAGIWGLKDYVSPGAFRKGK